MGLVSKEHKNIDIIIEDLIHNFNDSKIKQVFKSSNIPLNGKYNESNNNMHNNMDTSKINKLINNKNIIINIKSKEVFDSKKFLKE